MTPTQPSIEERAAQLLALPEVPKRRRAPAWTALTVTAPMSVNLTQRVARRERRPKRATGSAVNDAAVAAEFAAGKLLLGWKARTVRGSLGFGLPEKAVQDEKRTGLFSVDHEQHVCVLGPTGCGKGVSSLMPSLLTYPGPVVVVDVKGEAVAVASRQRRRLRQRVVVIDPFEITEWKNRDSFNPLDIQRLTQEPVEDLAMELAQLLRGGSQGSLKSSREGDFWDVRGDGLNSGLLAHLLGTPSEEMDRTLITMRDLLMGDDPIYFLAAMLDKIGKTMPKLAYQQIASFLGTTEITRSGILATATERLSALFHPGVETALRSTSFDLAAFRDGRPISIFLVIPPGKLQSHGRVLRIWLAALLSLLQSRRRRPAQSTLFLVDEAAQLGAMEPLRVALTLLRGYGVRTISYWQDLAQIKQLYGDWESLINNCSLQILGTNTLLAARAASELTGPAFSAEAILTLPEHQGILIEKGRASSFQKLNYLTDDLFAGLASPHPMYASSTVKRIRPPQRVTPPADTPPAR